jgi:hypothetical protein
MEKCQICDSVMEPSFRAKVLRKFEACYFLCPSCGFLRSEKPYWLDEAYSSAIAITDTGLVARNIKLAHQTATLIFTTFDPRAKYVDVSGGYGLLVRLLRDIGLDFYWEDPYCENIHAKGFEATHKPPPFATCTAFEVMEHLHDPLDFVRTQLQRYECSTMLFTTELYKGQNPPSKEWWYYSFSTGQHVSFYTRSTLERMAEALGLRFYTFSGIHIFTDKEILCAQLRKVLLRSSASALFARYVQYRLKSLTFADHQLLSQ